MNDFVHKIATSVLYTVVNSEGQFFRRKGYGGRGSTWVDDLATARIYSKIGPARAIVTFFANHFPAYPPPMLVQICISGSRVINETERVEKAVRAKKLEREEHAVQLRRFELERAQRDLEDAQRRLDAARRP